jgi:hypothetical protein
MPHRRMLFPALGAVMLAGCSRSYSTAVDPQTGRQRIYAMEQTEALALAHGAIVRSFPGRRIETIDGPVRGYSTYTRMMLDTFTQQIVVRPVSGRTAQGEVVNGYTFEISGSGTSGSGAWRNDAFFEALQRDLAASGRGVEVTGMSPRIEAAAPAASARPPASDPIDQLRRLRELRDQGTITGQEYERTRSELLRRI